MFTKFAQPHAEPALHNSTTALAEVADALPDGICLFDRDWRLVYANRKARAVSQIEDRHLRMSHWDIWPDTVGQPLETVYRRAMRERSPARIEPFFYAPLAAWFDIHLLPVDAGLAVYYRDITEEKSQQQASANASERASLALSATNGVGTWDWDVPNNRVHADSQFAGLHGVAPARAIVGVPLAEFVRTIHPEDIAATTSAIELALRNGGSFCAEYRIVQAAGKVLWVAARGRCTLAPDGSPLRLTGVAVDISERKQTQAILVQTEKLAAVGRMASSIAHEINNPLESVTNLIFIAQQHAVSPEVKHYLSLADQELRRVSMIANQTLRFHKQSSIPRAISPEQLFSTVLSLYEGRLRNSGVIVRKRLQRDISFCCFEGDIRQALNNLVGNAIDAMPHGGTLHLRSRYAFHAATGQRGVVLTIADTGSGISPEVQPHIFDAFFTTKGDNGNGLGLWITRGILERHHGSVRVRSRQGQTVSGSIFSIFLPSDAPVTNRTAGQTVGTQTAQAQALGILAVAAAQTVAPAGLLSN